MTKTLFLPLIGFLILFPFYTSIGQSQQNVDTTSKAFDFIKDDFIAAALDSLANLKYFEGYETASDRELESAFGFSAGFVPVYSDSVYYDRLRKLDASTPINLTYNQYVRDYIELYAVKKRSLTERVMGLAKIYFPMFEEQLDKFNMPLELKYLAIVESALNPEARSRVGATGLWQFMYGTGKMYDLNVTSFVDDRRDPIKSTVAACEHMNDLYKMYKDWLLVLAAYNSGAGNVNKAIRRSGGKMDFWQIRPFLPLETRGYVPAFIGVTYVMNYAAEHNLRAAEPIIRHYEIDTITVKEMLTFNQISDYIKVPMEDLQFLNPSYKAGVIPAVNGKPYVLRLPKKYIASFVNNEAQLYALGTQKKIEQEQLLSMMKTVTSAEYHRVKRGENLGLISNKYHCSVTDLKRWNRLRSTKLAVGQRLIVRPERVIEQQFAAKKPDTTQVKKIIQPKIEETLAAVDTSVKTPITNQSKVKYEDIRYTVQKGQTLNKIAQANNVTLDDLKQWNNLSNTIIHPGDLLIVGKKEIPEPGREVLADNKSDKKAKNNQFIYYTVQRGDTLWTIAKKHQGCSVEDIKKLNNIRNEKSIVPGQKIKVAVAF
ncbi:MAG TPA: LysM peptidoglycan-binding domain-containing protein [Lentimicrobium sp.]|nr:LysM peptidoglycan-binding domain-containing protein [Lentimicrobium sp.]